MKRMLLLFLFYFPFLTASGQKKLYNVEEITVADLQLKSCSFEPDAPAMKLLDIEMTTFDLFTYGTKIKIERTIRRNHSEKEKIEILTYSASLSPALSFLPDLPHHAEKYCGNNSHNNYSCWDNTGSCLPLQK